MFMENQTPIDSQNSLPVKQANSRPSLAQKKITFLFVVITALVCAVIFGFGGYYLGRSSLSINQNADETISQPIPSPSIDPSQIGVYKNCHVYFRRSRNFMPDDTTLIDRSEVRCESNGEEQVLFQVFDKTGIDPSQNNIYNVWKDAEGYKALIVDSNGAGSGEGIGKIILLQNKTYELLTCFYHTPEFFSETPNLSPMSDQDMAIAIMSTYNMDDDDPGCSNFIIKSIIEGPKLYT